MDRKKFFAEFAFHQHNKRIAKKHPRRVNREVAAFIYSNKMLILKNYFIARINLRLLVFLSQIYYHISRPDLSSRNNDGCPVNKDTAFNNLLLPGCPAEIIKAYRKIQVKPLLSGPGGNG